MFTFDATITLGTVLTLLTMLGAVGVLAYRVGRAIEQMRADLHGYVERVDRRLGIVESRVSDLWESWKEENGR